MMIEAWALHGRQHSLAGHISQRHGVGHKPGKVLGQGRVADLTAFRSATSSLATNRISVPSILYCSHKGPATNRNQLLAPPGRYH